MCTATRFPEVVLLRKITASSVVKALVKFFSTFSPLRVIQTDQGTNFQSKLFKQVLQTLNDQHSVTSTYHLESQGALERWHQTLKSMLRKYCIETEKNWDEGVLFVVFAAREAIQESLRFSPAQTLSLCGPDCQHAFENVKSLFCHTATHPVCYFSKSSLNTKSNFLQSQKKPLLCCSPFRYMWGPVLCQS